MLKRFNLIVCLMCGISMIFAQSNGICQQENEAMFRIGDWHSDRILLMTSADSLYPHYGKAKKIFPPLKYSITDSVVSTGDGGFHYETSTIDIRFIHYLGLQYVQYKDSVQLIFIDFMKTKAKLVSDQEQDVTGTVSGTTMNVTFSKSGNYVFGKK